MSQQYWEGADLVMEVFSLDDPSRDLEIKRDEYARRVFRSIGLLSPILARLPC